MRDQRDIISSLAAFMSSGSCIRYTAGNFCGEKTFATSVEKRLSNGGPGVHSDVASAAGPHLLRILSALCPHYSRSLSAPFPRHLRSVTVFPHCFRCISVVFPHCFRCISAVFPVCFPGISALLPQSFRGLWLCQFK